MSNWTPPGYQPPQGQPGPYVPPGTPQGAPPVYPPQGAPPGYPPQGAPPGYPPQGAPPGYPPQGAPPGYPPQGAPGYPPQGAPPGYPPQGAPPGYPPQGAPPGPYMPPGGAPGWNPGAQPGAPAVGGAPFQAVVPNFDAERDPELPPGSSVFVCTGKVEIVADGKLLKAECYCENSNNLQSVGQLGWWKCWLQRPSIKGNGGAQAASNDIAKFALTLAKRDFKQVDQNTSLQYVNEFVRGHTINGQPIAGLRFGADVVHKVSAKQNLFASCQFHVIP